MDAIYIPPKPAIILPRQPEIIRPGDPRFVLPNSETWAKRQSLTPGTLGVNAIGGKKRRRKAGGNDAFTVALLHFDGTDGATSFPDTNAGGSAHTWTASGNAQIDTAQSKFGSGSLLLDGTGDYISTPDSADFDFGAGEFTIDCWIRLNALPTGTIGSGNGAIIAAQWTGGSRAWVFGVGFSSGSYQLAFTFNSTTVIGSNISLATGTWYHVAVVRDNTGTDTLRFFHDGAPAGTNTTIDGITISNSTAPCLIGQFENVSFFNGWIDEFRISKGIARWTSGFTPASAAYA